MKKTLSGLMSLAAIIAVGVFAAAHLAQPAAAQLAAAGDPPLAFGDNFFVTGDYVVAGASGLNTNFTFTNNGLGFTTGTITVPDGNPGISGSSVQKRVPDGAQIVAALLYWQTVEKISQLGSGKNGFFRPVFPNGPATGYPIAGVDVTNHSTVSFSSGGCSGTSTGKTVRTYRAEVRAFLPQDSKGNIVIDNDNVNDNGKFNKLTFEVRLPSAGNSTPLALGATLVLIYRVLDPTVPLNSIVIYDGAAAATSSSQSLTQTIQGFYDASTTASSLTYIVGSGQSNKFQTVSFGNNPALPSLYGKNHPDFLGWYGTWDNVRWSFPQVGANPLTNHQASVQTAVTAAASMGGCVSEAAIILSTTVNNTDGDGLLDSWKNNQGYCDASFNEAGTMVTPGTCTAAASQWVDLPNAATPGHGKKDVYLQLDYMCYKLDPNFPNGCDTSSHFTNSLSAASAASGGNTTYTGTGVFSPAFPLNTFVTISGFTKIPAGSQAPPNNGNFIVVDCAGSQTVVNNVVSCTGPQLTVNNPNGIAESNASGSATFTDYSFDPRVTDTITGANSFDEVSAAYLSKGITLHPEWHAMQETPECADTVVNGVPSYCPYLNQLGMVGWKGGFDVLKGQPLNYPDELSCENAPALPSPNACVRRFQHGRKDSYHEVILAHAQGGPEWSFQAGTLTTGSLCPAGIACVAQVGNSVTFYTSTSNGLGAGVGNDQNPLHRVTISDSITKTMLSGTYLVQSATDKSFTIHVPFSANATYTPLTDPRLSATSGRIHTRSGYSDVGGADSLITLGRWDPVIAQQITGTTFMHEIGHANGLTHGGFYYDGRAQNPNDYRPTVEANCKPNLQSVMSYPFQLNHLDNGTAKVVDYSEQQLDQVNEATPPGSLTPSPFYPFTLWYTPTKPSASASAATFSCEGIAVPPPTMYLVSGSVSPITPGWANGQDINFDFSFATQMRGHGDWANTNSLINGLVNAPAMDLRQVGAAGADAFGSGGSLGAGGGSLGAGGGSLGAGGGSLGAGGGSLGAGGGSLGAGGGSLGAGGGSLGAGGGIGEIDFATATAVTYPPGDLTATEGVSPRTITLNWTPGFGLVGFYKIYRSDDGGQTFNVVGTVNAPTTQFVDNPACKPTGYQYFVTAVQSSSSANAGQESGPSNTVTKGQNNQTLTGCYVVTNFTPSPTSAVQGRGAVQIAWTLTDLSNALGQAVTRQAANTLVAVGPVPNSCALGRTTLLADGVPTIGVDGFTTNNNQFTFTWNNTDSFCAGSYKFELDLDHVNGGPAQVQLATSPLQLGIDVTDTDNPQITTTAIANGVVGTSYTNIISEHGGVTGANPFVWALANGLTPPPPGLSIATANDGVSGLLSGIPSAAGMFSFTVQVTDFAGNKGTQTLTMTVTTPVAQINQALVPDSAVPGAAQQVALTLNGTGFGPGSKVLWNGTDLGTTTFVSNRRLTATVPVADVTALGTASISVSNPVTVGNKAVPKSNIDFFQVSPTTSASLSRTDYPTGMSPNGVIAADFNGDAKIDLAIANSADGSVSILLGNGDGTFTASAGSPLSTGASSAPNSLIAGDFNGDGVLDLAVANFSTNTVAVFLGTGGGAFSAAVTYPVASGPFFVIAGDFNRDGALDLAVVNQNGQFVSILLGNGDGTFQPKVDYAAGGTAGGGVAAVALGDFDRDGKLDLAVTNPGSGNVSVLLGNGDGTFKAPAAYATGNAGDHPLAVSAVDLRGTGILDLAVTNVNAKTVAILLGNGDGTFQPRALYNTTSSASVGPGAIITGDFNADGKVDLAITNQSANAVSILLGNGDGTLQNAQESPTGTFAAGVAAGDFNGDGRLDVAVANLQDNTVSVLLQRPEPASNLAVTGATASQVSLSWTASPSTTILGYNVYRSTSSGTGYTKVNNGGIVGMTTFIDITVAPGTTYFYVVTAVDPNSLESVNSNEVTATTPPQAPQNLTGTEQGTPPAAESVLLNWSASTNAVSYNVYRSTTTGGPYGSPIGSVNAATTTFTDTTVVSGTTYYYVVTAVGPANAESAFSNEVTEPIP